MGQATVLVVDDSADTRTLVRAVLERAGHAVRTAASGVEAVQAYRQERADLCVVDLSMPQMDGMDVLRELRSIDPTVQVMMLTAHGTIERAVEAMRAGAIDFLTKPVDPDHLLARIERALQVEAILEENRALRAEVSERYGFDKIIAHSAAMRQVVALARQAAQRDVTVLITGESGVGKEVVARAIHYNGPRRSGPFLAVNCAAIAENLVESELFGHEKGAFTGADRKKAGLIERAAKGTLLLDEIGDMPQAAQAKLLRVIDSREMYRVGGTEALPVSARLIAATNADLEGKVRQREFREDLFYRLNVFAIHIPPLRERREDIVPLARHVLARLSREMGQEAPEFTDEALEYILNAPWPGNARELANAIERALIVSRGNPIRREHFPPPPFSRGSIQVPESTVVPDGTLEEVEKAALLRAIERSGGNLSRAARLLGMGRGALRYRLEKYGIDPRSRSARNP